MEQAPPQDTCELITLEILATACVNVDHSEPLLYSQGNSLSPLYAPLPQMNDGELRSPPSPNNKVVFVEDILDRSSITPQV